MTISAGIGIFVLGLLTILAEKSTGANTWLAKWQWGKGVGALAGRAMVGALCAGVVVSILTGRRLSKTS